jgi:hypothetical protein
VAFKNKFDAGELDKWCLGLVDDPAYTRGCAWLENFNLIRQGGLNRRKGYKLVQKILDNKNDEYVKLIPISIDDQTNYVVYISKSSYGYLEFNRYTLVNHKEHEWPVLAGVSEDRTVQYRNKDPYGYWKITEVKSLSSTPNSTLAVGDELLVSGPGVKQSGTMEILAAAQEASGKLLAVEDFVIDAAPIRIWTANNTLVTQEPTKIASDDFGEVSFFEEEGVGQGLKLKCTLAADEKKLALDFQVLEGGSGFKPEIGKTSTLLNMAIVGVGNVTTNAVVGAGGNILSVQSVTLPPRPTDTGNSGACFRYMAPVIQAGLYSEIYAYNDLPPSGTAATLDVEVEEVSPEATEVGTNEVGTAIYGKSEWELGRIYKITLRVGNTGRGFLPVIKRYRIGAGNIVGIVPPFPPPPSNPPVITLKIEQVENSEWDSEESFPNNMYAGASKPTAVSGWITGTIAKSGGVENDIALLFLANNSVFGTITNGSVSGSWSVTSATRILVFLTGVLNDGTTFSRTFTILRGVRADIAYLKLIYYSQVSNEFARRELRIVARLDENGSIQSVEPLLWIDDDIVPASVAEKEPNGGEGDCYSKIFDNGDYAQAYSVHNDKSSLIYNPLVASYDIVGLSKGASATNYKFGGCYGFIQRYYGTWYMFVQGYVTNWVSGPYVTGSLGWNFPWATNNGHVFDAYFPYPKLDRSEQILRRVSRMCAASGCPKPLKNLNISTTVYINFYKDGVFYNVPYAQRLQKDPYPSIPTIHGWYLPCDGHYAWDDMSMFSEPATADSGEVMVENVEVEHGSGAELEISSTWEAAPSTSTGIEQYGTLVVSIKTKKEGSGYLMRSVQGIEITAKSLGGTEKYKFLVYAARGSEGKLVLRKQDGEAAAAGAAVEYHIPAKLFTEPPDTGMQINLVEANTNFMTTVGVEVTPKLEGTQLENLKITGWNVKSIVPKTEAGLSATASGVEYGDRFTASWIKNIVPYEKANCTGPLGAPLGIEAVKTYTGSIKQPDGDGMFAADITGYHYFSSANGNLYDVIISGMLFVGDRTLNDLIVLLELTSPETNYYELDMVGSPELLELDTESGMPTHNELWIVSTDETLGLNRTIWRYKEGVTPTGEFSFWWESVLTPAYPFQEEQIKTLQYIYTGKILVVVGRGITPMVLKFAEADILVEPLGCDLSVKLNITAPEDFALTPENIIMDEAIPPMFGRSVEFSPTVVGYIGGRLLFGGLMEDTSRIYVSRPQRDKAANVYNFSTYDLFLTITAELKAFIARNDLGTTELRTPNEGVIDDCIKYASEPVKATKHAKVSFGYDRPRIVATPYFQSGAYVLGASTDITLGTSSVAVPNEYTEAGAATLRAKTAAFVAYGRMKLSIVAGLSSVSADCDGFSVDGTSATQFLGVSSSVGPIPTALPLVPYTKWGSPAEKAGIIASAALTCVGKAAGNIPLTIGTAAVAAVLGVASAAVTAIMNTMWESIRLTKTDGTVANASKEEVGITTLTTDGFFTKCEYLLAIAKLYEDKQPFLLHRWKVEEKEYSTVDCGFTFIAASESKEGISVLTEMRSIFVATDSSERVMPSTVNGETQSMQTNSFFGAERLQVAKGADALYFVQRGGQSIMRAFYQPNVPVPSISDVMMYNKEILRDREVISLKSAKTLPVNVWCVMDDGAVAMITDEGGKIAWGRISTTAGKIRDTVAMPLNGNSALRVVAVRNSKGMFIGGIPETYGAPNDTYLDLWDNYYSESQKSQYRPAAPAQSGVVYDPETRQVYALDDAPPPRDGLLIGYLFFSRMRALPLPLPDLRPTRTARVKLRLMESHLPFIKRFLHTLPQEQIDELPADRLVGGDWGVDVDVPRDGVVNVPAPTQVEQDSSFEIFTSMPLPLSVICMATEEEQ